MLKEPEKDGTARKRGRPRKTEEEKKQEVKVKAPFFTQKFPLPFVYICSPYSGSVRKNAAKARLYCRFAINNYRVPIAPHLLYPGFLDDKAEKERAIGIYCGLCLLDKCSEVWVFGDVITKGMEQEIYRARFRGKVIRYFSEDMEVRKRPVIAGGVSSAATIGVAET